MSKYNKGTIYRGNLMEYINGTSTIIKENIELIYDEKTDSFYSYLDTFNYFLDLDLNPNLINEKRKAYNKIIKDYNYSYTNHYIEGEKYIDENSIVEINFNKSNVKK